MLSTCPYCNGPVPRHGTCCRVPDDLDRFERVLERLSHQPDKHFLLENLERYLVAYGRRDGLDMGLPPQPFLGRVNSATTGA